MYPAPSGVREDIHVRFMAAVRRATQAAALPLEALAETPDDEEAEGGTATAGDHEEDLGAGVEVH